MLKPDPGRPQAFRTSGGIAAAKIPRFTRNTTKNIRDYSCSFVAKKLESEFRRDLECARAAGAEDSAGRRNRTAETRRAEVSRVRRSIAVADQHVRETGIIHIRDAQDVRHVEEIEHLDDRFQPRFFAQPKDLRHPQIEG